MYPDCGFKFVLNLDETAKFNLTLIQRLQYISNLFSPASLIWIWNLEFQFLIKSFVSIASSLFISNYKILGTRLRIPVHHHHFGGSIMKPNMDFRSKSLKEKIGDSSTSFFFHFFLCEDLSKIHQMGNILSSLKVSKSQKHYFLTPHCPKNKRNIWQNSALASFDIYRPLSADNQRL